MIQYGLCGRTLKHSYSKIIHELLGNEQYNLYSLEKDEFYELMESKGFKALNVTIPYKTDAYNLCDVVSEEAKNIGSVNTVVNKDGKLYGYNTDYAGFVYMLKRAKIDIKGKKVLIFGSGGTSLTARAVCKAEGARQCIVVSRKGQVNYDNVYLHSDAEIIINTTPVGMYPDNGRKIIELSKFPDLTGVVDVIYNPLKTALVLEAQKRGLPCTTGLSMLVAQAVRAHEYFFDVKIEDCVIEDVLVKCMKKILNVVFVGMPGCGKTSVGKEYARITGRSFLDTDVFVEQCGMSIPEIFEKYSEEYFRDKETQAIEMLCALSEKVIATGGGAVKREKNIELIKQNGIVVYLKRELEKLSTDCRPLSAGGYDKILELYEQRHEIYENAADIIIETHEDVAECAQRLYRMIDEKLPTLF
ncbi:MAG: shikimate dehydrogenase [Clostridia bacterium]|nr:shikimate dehydrogenase [Clostridia bacterium]